METGASGGRTLMREDAVGGTEEPATEVAASRLLGSWFGELGVPPSWQVVQQSV